VSSTKHNILGWVGTICHFIPPKVRDSHHTSRKADSSLESAYICVIVILLALWGHIKHPYFQKCWRMVFKQRKRPVMIAAFTSAGIGFRFM
jgi:hypothetical protein